MLKVPQALLCPCSCWHGVLVGCPGSNVTEEEVRVAEDKFEESKSSAETAMHNLLEAEVGGARLEILSQDMYPVTKCASCHGTCVLLQNMHPVAGHILLQNRHPVAGHTPYCKTCILSKDVHPVEGYASSCKTHNMLKDRHPLAKHAFCCRTCILLQNRHPVEGCASCQSVENKEVCFCVCVGGVLHCPTWEIQVALPW